VDTDVLSFEGSLLQQGIRSLVLAVCMETLVMYVFAGAGYIKLMWREKHPIIVKGWRAYLKKLELFFTQNIPVKSNCIQCIAVVLTLHFLQLASWRGSSSATNTNTDTTLFVLMYSLL
jgi:hypothetical protein